MSTTGNEKRQTHAQHYQITVCGKVDPSWSAWFNGLKIHQAKDKNGLPITRITGELPDQGALRGVLNKLWDLNLSLISVKCQRSLLRRK